MDSPGGSGAQLVIVALVAILVVAVVAAAAIAVINSNNQDGPAEPTPILPPILPTDAGSGYPRLIPEGTTYANLAAGHAS